MSRNTRITMNAALKKLLATQPISVEASASNNVNYIEVLENGRMVNSEGRLQGSEQAPEGFVRAFMPEYEQFTDDEVKAEYDIELAKPNPDLRQAVINGIDSAALGITGMLISRTPIDTSRARNAWQTELTDGEIIKSGGEQ